MERIVAGAIIGILMYLLLKGISSAKRKVEISQAEKDSRNNPDDVEALIKLGKKLGGKDNKRSMEVLESAFARNPKNYDAAVLLSLVHHSGKNYQRSSYLLKEIFDGKNLNEGQRSEIVGIYELALARYFYGHVKHMDGLYDEAAHNKKVAMQATHLDEDLKSTIESLNYY